MIRVAHINRNVDGTWTVRVGRKVEHVDPQGKTQGEIFEAVRWALISKGVIMEEVELVEIMWGEKS